MSNVADVVRAGLLASFTGGWYFDPHAGAFSFTNAAHLYLWLFLFCYPFSLFLAAGSSPAVWSVYPLTIALLFLVVKYLNRMLHRMFDGDTETGADRDGEEEVEEQSRGERLAGGAEEEREEERASELETTFVTEAGETSNAAKFADGEQRQKQEKVDKLDSFGRETPSDNSHSDDGLPYIPQQQRPAHIEGEELAAALASLPRRHVSDPVLSLRTTEVNVTVHDVPCESVARQASENSALGSSPVKDTDITTSTSDIEPATQSIATSHSLSDVASVAISTCSYVPTPLERLKQQERNKQPELDDGIVEDTKTKDQIRSENNVSDDTMKTRDGGKIAAALLTSLEERTSLRTTPLSYNPEEETTLLSRTTRSNTVENMSVSERLAAAGVSADLVLQLAGGGSSDGSVIHIATSDLDTSAGAVHCYQDEFGQLQAYLFDVSGNGEMIELNMPVDIPLVSSIDSNHWTVNSMSSVSTLDTNPNGTRPRLSEAANRSQEHDIQSIHSEGVTQEPEVKYHFKLFSGFTLPVKFDRLALVTVFDRDKNWLDIILSAFMATAVSILGYWLLVKDFYFDFWILWFCFVMGSCQYCLMKSVDPDSASPAHGDGSINRLSRAVYFCIIAVIILIVDAIISSNSEWDSVRLYGLPLFSRSTTELVRDALAVVLLCFPILFLLGLLPQVNTFATYVLEQVDIHVFGGTAATSFGSALFNLVRSMVSVAVLYGFAYSASNSYKPNKTVIFSVFIGLLVGVSYLQSRLVSCPKLIWEVVAHAFGLQNETAVPDGDVEDPLPLQLRTAVRKRLSADILTSLVVTVVFVGVHASSAFATLQPDLESTLYIMAAVIGIVTHYLLPQLRKQLPWLCFANPILKSAEYKRYEVTAAAKLMWFERMESWLGFLERNVMYPAVFMSGLTSGFPSILEKFGSGAGALIVTICGLKMMQNGFVRTSWQFVVVSFTVLLFKYDFPKKDSSYCQTAFCSETFPIDYFFVALFLSKFYELVQKMKFVLVYIVPWQIPWGSAFHAFAQPLSIPHSAMLFFQLVVSAVLSAPLSPLVGSGIFLTSYVRPVKFWERDYNTKRVDHSNTRLAAQLDRDPGGDDNNLNSIFYEHLTRSLQQTLAGDLALGRWGQYTTGDCFILASDYLNALVHIIEIGNGLVTFQLRGLEFRGTYCQQREVEAITEGVNDDEGCCCCSPGHIPGMLSVNAAFSTRWLAWEVTTEKYVLEGYSITDNNAASMLQVFELRKILVTYYVQAIIYYALTSPKLEEWLSMPALEENVYTKQQNDLSFRDVDPAFHASVDEDFDERVRGVSRKRFVEMYHSWIKYCIERGSLQVDNAKQHSIVSLCFSLSVLGRRALGSAAQNQITVLESFLYGLHALVKGDFRITSSKDEWVFADMDLLNKVVLSGVRMALKLHQDHFAAPDEYDDPQVLYDTIRDLDETMVICHEGDPAWRHAVLSSRPSLLSLRHVVNEGTGEYKIIMLNRRFLNFRVVKVNSECVQGLWAGQQQELVFFRNSNPERGSIQNAKQVLRNMINSSCDQPIGYPIYVSPLTTSFALTHSQLSHVTGRLITFGLVGHWVQSLYRRIRACIHERRRNPCFSSSAPTTSAPAAASGSMSLSRREINQYQSTPTFGRTPSAHLYRHNIGSHLASSSSIEFGMGGSSSNALGSVQTVSSKGSVASESNLEKLTTTVDKKLYRMGAIEINDVVQITDTALIYRRSNVEVHGGSSSSLLWPNEEWRAKGGTSGWDGWFPQVGSRGKVVHLWRPYHPDPYQRSTVLYRDCTLLLLEMDSRYVPILESGVAVQV
ncbi:pecanex-like protein 1 isoform X2 [Corticium candelabrum]|uniref:pecanex-like protein 1 isoform X2 n=1 Tax=Corticium candelabrum TaxID=121492 RepID=UPI002E2744A4|nr:pecanex-like protein 1 isoform X2 [Corticium candelabrum]